MNAFVEGVRDILPAELRTAEKKSNLSDNKRGF
jgi:hypothetical protein